jgi:hypothetical protein
MRSARSSSVVRRARADGDSVAAVARFAADLAQDDSQDRALPFDGAPQPLELFGMGISPKPGMDCSVRANAELAAVALMPRSSALISIPNA